MLSFQRYIFLNRLIIILLVLNKLYIHLIGLINIETLLVWVSPLIFFYFFLKKPKPKVHQSFCFILLVYFMLVCLRVFGMSGFFPDIIELILVVVMFLLTAYATKIIINEKNPL